MQYLKFVTLIHPGTVIKMYASDKKFYFVSLCYASFTYDRIAPFYLEILNRVQYAGVRIT